MNSSVCIELFLGPRPEQRVHRDGIHLFRIAQFTIGNVFTYTNNVRDPPVIRDQGRREDAVVDAFLPRVLDHVSVPHSPDYPPLAHRTVNGVLFVLHSGFVVRFLLLPLPALLHAL